LSLLELAYDPNNPPPCPSGVYPTHPERPGTPFWKSDAPDSVKQNRAGMDVDFKYWNLNYHIDPLSPDFYWPDAGDVWGKIDKEMTDELKEWIKKYAGRCCAIKEAQKIGSAPLDEINWPVIVFVGRLGW